MTAVWVVTGPPASGKTTALTTLLRQFPELRRFGVKDFILGLASRGEPLGLRLLGPVTRCEVLADADVRAALTLFLDQVPLRTETVLIEGYPRNARQIADLSEVADRRRLPIKGLIMVEATDDLVILRARHRYACAACALPAGAADARCAHCGGSLLRRADDEDSRLRARLADYRRVAALLRDAYGPPGLLQLVDGRMPHGEILRAMRELITPTLAADHISPATRAPDRTGSVSPAHVIFQADEQERACR